MVVIEIIELIAVNPGGILTDDTPEKLLDYYVTYYEKEK